MTRQAELWQNKGIHYRISGQICPPETVHESGDNMDFIEEAKYWIEKAREADPEFRVFGAEAHKYGFRPTIPLEEVRAFEQEHQLRLPENYVRVLTELGNGGAGPYYGLYPLDRIFEYSADLPEPVTGKAETFIDDTINKEKWNGLLRQMDESEDDAAYDALLEKFLANVIVIGTQGCTYDSLLMCGGASKGKVFNIDWNMMEDYGPIPSYMTFEEWYLGFFREVAAGNDLWNFGYIRLDSEEKLREDYIAAGSREEGERTVERERILASLRRFPRLSEKTVSVLTEYIDETVSGSLVSVINKTDKELAMDIFERAFNGSHPEQVALTGCRLSDEQAERFYKRAVKILDTPEYAGRLIRVNWGNGYEECAHMMFTIMGKCSARKTADFLRYITDETNPQGARKLGIYKMCQCPDIREYGAVLARLMKSGEYEIALAALKGALDAEVKSLPVLNAYKWMLVKYADDTKDMSRFLADAKKVLEREGI